MSGFEIILFVLVSFVIAFITMFIVSFFSGDGGDIKSIFIATSIVWGVNILFNLLGITGLFSMLIGTIVSMVVFMKFLGFEPTPSFLIGMLYSVIYVFLLAIVLSSLA